jgi:predicted MFS family arabinose efflux permease
MAAILVTLAVVVATIPAVRSLSGFGLLPYFLWGAMGWATVAPQQHILLGIHPEQGATLAALNGSAIGLGSGLGSALGGFALASGFAAQNLPYAAVGLLLVAVVWQLLLLEPLLRLSKEESECPVP